MTRALGIDVPISIARRLAVALVEHVEGPEAPAVVERVVHEVERPDLVERAAAPPAAGAAASGPGASCAAAD